MRDIGLKLYGMKSSVRPALRSPFACSTSRPIASREKSRVILGGPASPPIAPSNPGTPERHYCVERAEACSRFPSHRLNKQRAGRRQKTSFGEGPVGVGGQGSLKRERGRHDMTREVGELQALSQRYPSEGWSMRPHALP